LGLASESPFAVLFIIPPSFVFIHSFNNVFSVFPFPRICFQYSLSVNLFFFILLLHHHLLPLLHHHLLLLLHHLLLLLPIKFKTKKNKTLNTSLNVSIECVLFMLSCSSIEFFSH
jgi:hypothetical protein